MVSKFEIMSKYSVSWCFQVSNWPTYPEGVGSVIADLYVAAVKNHEQRALLPSSILRAI